MIVGPTPIYKIDLFGIKIEIYYQIMRVIKKSMCNHKEIYIINEV